MAISVAACSLSDSSSYDVTAQASFASSDTSLLTVVAPSRLRPPEDGSLPSGGGTPSVSADFAGATVAKAISVTDSVSAALLQTCSSICGSGVAFTVRINGRSYPVTSTIYVTAGDRLLGVDSIRQLPGVSAKYVQ